MAKKDINLETVTLELDDGTEMVCDVISIFPAVVGGVKKMYIALLDENAGEDGDIFLYGAENLEDPDNIILNDIESDEEFEIVSDAFDEMLDDEELNEMLDGIGEDEDEE